MNFLILFLCILSLVACKADSEKKAEKAALNLVPGKLADIPGDVQTTGLVVSPYGHKVVYALKKGEKQSVVDGGKEGRPYDGIKDFVWSPDGRRFAYVGVKDRRLFVVVDGVEGRSYEDIGPPVFSPDGKTVAYEAQKAGKWHIVVGDRESKGADMHYMAPVFSQDGRLISYFEQHYHDNKTFRVVSSAAMTDRKTGREYETTGSVAFSQDKTQIAYVARRGDKVFLMSGGLADVEHEEETGPLDSARFLAFSPDVSKLAYLAEKQGRKFMSLGDKEIDYSKHTVIKVPVFSPDGRRLAVICERAVGENEKQYVLANDKEGALYDEVGIPVFSPDSSVLAYPARRQDKEFLVVDGREGPVYDKVLSPVFSPDSSRMAYRVRKEGKRFIVIADRAGKTLKEHPSYEAVWQPAFSPDGKSIAYGAAPSVPVKELWWKVEPVE